MDILCFLLTEFIASISDSTTVINLFMFIILNYCNYWIIKSIYKSLKGHIIVSKSWIRYLRLLNCYKIVLQCQPIHLVRSNTFTSTRVLDKVITLWKSNLEIVFMRRYIGNNTASNFKAWLQFQFRIERFRSIYYLVTKLII